LQLQQCNESTCFHQPASPWFEDPNQKGHLLVVGAKYSLETGMSPISTNRNAENEGRVSSSALLVATDVNSPPAFMQFAGSLTC
jgi:hypothetical protein